jgi:hypothetical protein
MLDNWKNPTVQQWTDITTLKENSEKPAPERDAKPAATPKIVQEGKKLRRMVNFCYLNKKDCSCPGNPNGKTARQLQYQSKIRV